MNNMKKPKRVALFVGVDKYEDSSIHPLAGAVADARALHEFFAKRGNQFDTLALLENPTSDAIIRKMRELCKDLSAGDFFLFYFAGHGMDVKGSQQLVCKNSMLCGSVLNNSFDPYSFQENNELDIAIVLDACRTPLECKRGSDVRMAARRDLGFYECLVKSHTNAGGSMNVLCSCDEGKTAGEVSKNGVTHGLFTLGLIDVLSKADDQHRGWLFNQDLALEIGNAMYELAGAAEKGGQRPWIQTSGAPPLLFMPNVDIEPLQEWVSELRKAKIVNGDIAAECLKALEGTSNKPGAKGIFEAIRFFSNWESERNKTDVKRGFVPILLESLCRAETHIEWRERPAHHVSGPQKTGCYSNANQDALLSSCDLEILEDLERRMRECDRRLPPRADGLSRGSLNYIGKMSQSEAVVAIDVLARDRMRALCREGSRKPLFTTSQRNAWHKKRDQGLLATDFEGAVYRLVIDDEFLVSRP